MLAPGTMVILIGREPDMPPVGTMGTVLRADPELLDGVQCYDVDFPNWPCSNPPDPSWICAETELQPVRGNFTPSEESTGTFTPEQLAEAGRYMLEHYASGT